MQIYWGDFENREDVASSFNVTLADDIEIVFAWYTYEDYSGDAFVLYTKGNKLFEVNGGHCSCYGLEDQWEPEVTSVAALRRRNFSNLYGDPNQAVQPAFEAVLAQLEARGL